MSEITEIDAQTAKQWVDDGDAILLDVREIQELEEARIDGALHNAMSTFDFNAVPKDGDKKVVVFCAHGMRSYQVADYLVREGMLEDAYSMAGGIVAWAQAGLPFDRG